MTDLRNPIDPDGLLEYSVVFTDRTLNHMSRRFQGVMTDLSTMLKEVYGAAAVALVPGSGTFGMEAVARQFATNKAALIVRNGLFSYRWSQILEQGGIVPEGLTTVLTAKQVSDETQAPWEPPPIEEVVATIETKRPALVFAAHVETASGIMLPDDYIRELARVTREAGGLFVLDCIASGAMWVDMRAAGVDVLLSAPQKGWSSAAGAGIVALSERALSQLTESTSSSFSLDLSKWLAVMKSYEEGSHSYYATLPTMTFLALRDAMRETLDLGLNVAREKQAQLGRDVRALLKGRGLPSVAADGYEAPGVVVSYTSDPAIRSGKKLAEAGLQVAAGVPLMCGERADFSTFRMGLFGLDKLNDVEGTVARLATALDTIGYREQ